MSGGKQTLVCSRTVHSSTVAKHFEMNKFNPPISTYNTQELIGIIYSEKGAWVEDVKNQAKQELIKRNVSQKEQEKVVLKWKKRQLNISQV